LGFLSDTNAEVIAIDQDPLGIQGTVLYDNCPVRLYEDLSIEARVGNFSPSEQNSETHIVFAYHATRNCRLLKIVVVSL
jgi:hypothetical protein